MQNFHYLDKDRVKDTQIRNRNIAYRNKANSQLVCFVSEKSEIQNKTLIGNENAYDTWGESEFEDEIEEEMESLGVDGRK